MALFIHHLVFGYYDLYILLFITSNSNMKTAQEIDNII